MISGCGRVVDQLLAATTKRILKMSIQNSVGIELDAIEKELDH